MADLPEFVYFVTVDHEWPVSAFAEDNPPLMAGIIAREVERRAKSTNVVHPDEVKVWRARLTDVCQVDFTPAAVVPPSLTVRES